MITTDGRENQEFQTLVKKLDDKTYSISFLTGEIGVLTVSVVVEDLLNINLYKTKVNVQDFREQNKVLSGFDESDIFELYYGCFKNDKIKIKATNENQLHIETNTSISFNLKEKLLSFSIKCEKETDEKKLTELSNYKISMLSSEVKALREEMNKKGAFEVNESIKEAKQLLTKEFNDKLTSLGNLHKNETNVILDSMNVKLADFMSRVENILKVNKEECERNYNYLKEKYDNLSRNVEEINFRNPRAGEENPQKKSLVLSEKKNIKILHLTKQDNYCPTASALCDEASKAGITLQVIEYTGSGPYNVFESQGFDSVLVTNHSGKNTTTKENEGNFLYNFVMSGGNVVVTLWSNWSDYSPSGKFVEIQPHVPERDENVEKIDMVIVDKNHPIFTGVYSSIKIGSDRRLSSFTVNKNVESDLIATRDGGKPFIVTRKDLPGIITNMGFSCGSNGSQDGLKLVVNALRLSKQK